MIDQTRIYEYQPRALQRANARRRAERLRRAVLRAVAIALIAIAVYMALASLRQASAESEPCQLREPAPVECRVSPAPPPAMEPRAFLPNVARAPALPAEEGAR